MWTATQPENFSQFTPADLPAFLDWWEDHYTHTLALSLAETFAEGVLEAYLEQIAQGVEPPEWVRIIGVWRQIAQSAYELGTQLGRELPQNMAALIPASQIEAYRHRWGITPEDIARIPPAIRRAFVEGATASLQWVKSLTNEARHLAAQLLSIHELKNYNPQDAVPLLEQIMRRDAVARLRGVSPEQVSAEDIEHWLAQASQKTLLAIARRAETISRTETMRMMAIGTLATLEEQGQALCYVMPHRGSCPACRRLLDGRVFKIATLKNNMFANFGQPQSAWVASLPQHPNCRHNAQPLPWDYRNLTPDEVPDTGYLLPNFGLGADAAAALGLQ